MMMWKSLSAGSRGHAMELIAAWLDRSAERKETAKNGQTPAPRPREANTGAAGSRNA